MLARRKTVILTTHNMDEAERLADRVAIIDHGRLLVVDTPDALKSGMGEDSVVEIALEGQLGQNVEQGIQSALHCIQQKFPDTFCTNDMLTVRGADLAARLPELLQPLQAAGFKTGDVHMRTVTLEDVFLSLTGRGLRE
jgi:ABC-2 type transport system ATP-binding protein